MAKKSRFPRWTKTMDTQGTEFEQRDRELAPIWKRIRGTSDFQQLLDSLPPEQRRWLTDPSELSKRTKKEH